MNLYTTTNTKYVAIPIGGIGSRFSKNGYHMPKPFVLANGIPILDHVINSIPNENNIIILIGYAKELQEFDLETRLIKNHPLRKFLFKKIEYQTRGASETLFCMLNSLELNENSMILSIDCDTIQDTKSIVSFFSQRESALLYFKDEGNLDIYSFIDIDQDGIVTSIEEKVRISSNACSGGYGFSSVAIAKQLLNSVLLENNSKNECYLSTTFSKAIKNKIKIKSILSNEQICLGTPQELQIACSNNLLPEQQKRICFDLDGTLVSFPRVHKDYTTVEPIPKNISFLREMKKRGHTIIIYTARGMLSCKENLNEIERKHLPIINKTLKQFDIPFDELIIGKPIADFYIDDRAVNSYLNLNTELGIYNDIIKPRSSNSIIFDKEKVIKKTSNRGEIHWYNNIPNTCKHLFPHSITYGDEIIILDKIQGISYSSLFVNGSLTTSDLDTLISGLATIHRSKTSSDIDHNEVNDFYINKLIDRFLLFPERLKYRGEVIKNYFIDFFTKYSQEKKALISIIHGDPVFTNIFLDKNKSIKFIDMRGMIGNKCTIVGDKNYDYGKIVQSLLGYDFILRNFSKNKKYSESLLNYFLENIKCDEKEIITIAAYLFFTLIPLHHEERVQDESINISEKIINGQIL